MNSSSLGPVSTSTPPSASSRSRSRSSRGSLVAMLFVAALGSGGSGCMLSVEADMPDVEITQHDLTFEGIPNASQFGELATTMSFEQEHPALDFPKGIDSSVQAVKVDLIAKSGITSFDFLRSLRITMAPKGSTDAPTELINYQKVDGAVVGVTLTVPSKNPLNILDQWKADTALFDVQVAGVLPEQTWSLDMAVHFSGKVSYKY